MQIKNTTDFYLKKLVYMGTRAVQTRVVQWSIVFQILPTKVDDTKSIFPAQISLSGLFYLMFKSLIFLLTMMPNSQYTKETCLQY